MKFEFHPEAGAEYLQAVQFYEDQRSGLGAALISEFEGTMTLALARPLAWKVAYEPDIRRHYFSLDIFQRLQRWRPEKCPRHTDTGIAGRTADCGASIAAGTSRIFPMALPNGGGKYS